MRVVSLLVGTLLLAAPVFGQQAASTTSAPAETTTAVADQPPAHPITRAQVHEILQLTHAQALAHQSARNAFEMMKKSMPPYIPQDVLDDLQQQLGSFDIEPIAIAAYQKHISTEDAAQVIAFYKTPSGERLVKSLPAIEREMQMGGAQMGRQVALAVVARHMDEIKAAALKYKQEHSDTPKITSSN